MATIGNSKYITDLVNAPADYVARGATSSYGAAVKGDRMQVGLINKARGTGSVPHRHLNEQFNFVLRGTLVGEIDGESVRCPKGSVVHIPANTPHTLIGDPNDEDVIFFVVKDTTAGIGDAIPLDGRMDGPRLEKGFELDEKKMQDRNFLA